MTEGVKTKQELERVSQSQLGMFISLATNDNPLKIKKLSDLARDISLENNVDCRVEDLEQFYNLDAPIVKWDDIIDSDSIVDEI